MSDPVASLIPLLLLVLIFYLLVLRPARKRQRDFVKTQQALSEGLRIMLASGIYGTITALRDSEADVEIAAGTVITINRQAIASVIDESVDESLDESTDES
ncbi:preprotein translocase subunit YajC [Aeromicrobium sp. CTD01-1L150]|uniref:preprotein translocase subunit YajC n=1 Tax=Aeromicrobium sp. CTD01-1L150 TaxID=3341830 RepID=UPI0035BF92B9